MDILKLEEIISTAYDQNLAINQDIEQAVIKTIKMLDKGALRVAEKQNGTWISAEWLKQAILLYFKMRPMSLMGENASNHFWDKVNLKFAKWGEQEFINAGFRAVPGAIVREGSYIAPNVVLMPCFVNIGAYIGTGTMVDSWATVGSCAQIGCNVHISGGAGYWGCFRATTKYPYNY